MQARKLSQCPTLPPPMSSSYPGGKPTRSDHIFNIVYIFILLAIVAVFAALLFSRASAQANVCGGKSDIRYVSPWTIIQPQASHSFKHGFKCIPLELNVWAVVAFKNSEGVPVVAVPYLELHGALAVTAVDDYSIVLQNNSETMIWARVVARP